MSILTLEPIVSVFFPSVTEACYDGNVALPNPVPASMNFALGLSLCGFLLSISMHIMHTAPHWGAPLLDKILPVDKETDEEGGGSFLEPKGATGAVRTVISEINESAKSGHLSALAFRDRDTWTHVWLTNALMFFHTCFAYSLLMSGASPPFCWRYENRMRYVYPLRYVYYLCSAPHFISMPGHIWGTSSKTPLLCSVMAMACMILGFVAECLPPLSIGWIMAAALSSLTFLVASFYFWTFFYEAYLLCKSNESLRRIILIFWPAAMLLWFSFPGLWFLSCFGFVGAQAEIDALPIMDAFSKLCSGVFVVITTENFMREKTLLERDLYIKILVAERSEAVASNHAKRKFLRYVMHEARVPLNTVMIGLDYLILEAGKSVEGGGSSSSNGGRRRLALPMPKGGEMLASSRKVEIESPLARRHPAISLAPPGFVVTSEDTDLSLGNGVGLALADGSSKGAPLPLHSVVQPETDFVETLTIIKTSAVAIVKLFDEFLSLKKIEAGKMILETEEFEVEEMLEPALISFHLLGLTKNLTLALIVEPNMPRAIADLKKVQQVLGNYVSNAVKFSPIGSKVTIQVETEDASKAVSQVVTALTSSTAANIYAASIPMPPSKLISSSSPSPAPPPGAEVEPAAGLSMPALITNAPYLSPRFIKVTVSDQGEGISREDQKNLFLPFSQIGTKGPNKKGNGTGLGLWLCQQIVELGGGKVSCESELSKGSAFSFTFPISREGRGGGAPTSPSVDGRGDPQASFDGAMKFSTSESYETPLGSPLALQLHGRAPKGAATAASLDGPKSAPLSPKVQPLEERAGERAIEVAPSNSITSSASRPLTFLRAAVVVDDEKSNRDLFAKLLRIQGVSSCHVCSDGKEAFEYSQTLSEEDYQSTVWFLDKEMPYMDGFALAKALKSAHTTAYIIGITGNALAEDQIRFVQSGANFVLSKPVSWKSIESALAMLGFSLPGKAHIRNAASAK